ncbi:hypothetical protein ACM66B_003608 [Microbotryomycetes sp. NB124-2]
MDELTAHAPLVGYFALIAGLCVLTAPQVVRHERITKLPVVLFGLLAIASLATTWRYMFKYFVWSKHDAAHQLGRSTISSREWLQAKSLFHEAWHHVCSTADKWWWSEQLCLWTVSGFTVFLAVEGHRRQVRHVWAFMLLGQVVAISFAQNLFMLALESRPRQKATDLEEYKTDYRTLFSVALALGTVAVVPATLNSNAFLANLLIMHILLFVPLISRAWSGRSDRVSVPLLYGSSAVICFITRLPTLSAVATQHELSSPALLDPGIYKIMLKTLFVHPAQSSIGFDVVFATASFAAWMLYEAGKRPRATPQQWFVTMLLIASMPGLGVAVSGSLWLALRESDRDRRAEKAE